MDIILLRHGQSEANIGLTDHLDSPLTPLGQEQARLAGARLGGEGITKAYVSPLRRALQTVAPFCETSTPRAEVYADVCEYFNERSPGYHTFPGLSPEQIRAQFPFTFFGHTFPCGEAWWPSPLENDARMFARAERVRDALLGLYAGTGETLLVVSHAETVGRLTEAFLRHPPVGEGQTWPDPPWSDNCGLTRLRVTDPARPAALLYQNDTSHLAPLTDRDLTDRDAAG